MDYSPPGSSIHRIFQARILVWVAIPFSREIFPTQRLNPGLLHCRQILYCQSHQGSPYFNIIKAKYDKSQLTSFSKVKSRKHSI